MENGVSSAIPAGNWTETDPKEAAMIDYDDDEYGAIAPEYFRLYRPRSY